MLCVETPMYTATSKRLSPEQDTKKKKKKKKKKEEDEACGGVRGEERPPTPMCYP